MNNSKIRVDLVQGTLEAEGTEDFVRSVYADFKESLKSGLAPSAQKTLAAPPKTVTPSAPAADTRKKKSGGSHPAPTIVKDLDLSGGGKKPRLKDFYGRYKAASNMERNLIFVYYLNHELQMQDITVDHVFSCYRHISGLKSPEALRQSILDTSSRRGWLDTASMDNIKVAVPGINYLEHDMPKADAG